MIARSWGCKVPLAHATGFYRHLLQTGVEDYRQHPECIEIKLLRRDIDGWAHFLLLSVWASMEAIRAYAGDAPDKAVLYPNDDAWGLVPDELVTHYELMPVTLDYIEEAEMPLENRGMSRESHVSPQLAAPIGPFAHAVHSAELVFLSGQIGQEPSTGALVGGGASGQAHQILANLHTLLKELALGFDHVVKINIYLANMADFAQVNGVYAEHFTAPYPARTTVAVRELPLGALVEMEAIARKR